MGKCRTWNISKNWSIFLCIDKHETSWGLFKYLGFGKTITIYRRTY